MTSFRTVLIVAAAAFSGLAATAVVGEELDLPEAPGKVQVQEACTQCHGVDLIVAQPHSPEEWSQIVSRMIGNGAALTDEQYKIVLAYLSTNLAPPPPSPAENAKAASAPAAR